MHYMIIERFRDGNPLPVYRRFREQGPPRTRGLAIRHELGDGSRVLLPGHGVRGSQLLTQWTARWADLIEFEIIRW